MVTIKTNKQFQMYDGTDAVCTKKSKSDGGQVNQCPYCKKQSIVIK